MNAVLIETTFARFGYYGNIDDLMKESKAQSNDEIYRRLSLGLHHQYDKHSDELITDPVVDALKETKHLLKADFLEIRRTWFADNHE